MGKEIWQYVKNKNNTKIVGVLYASSVNDDVIIGFSKCHTKFDKFNKSLSLDIAAGRALRHRETLISDFNIPFDIRKDLFSFIKRCVRYYNDKNFPAWVMNIYHMNEY